MLGRLELKPASGNRPPSLSVQLQHELFRVSAGKNDTQPLSETVLEDQYLLFFNREKKPEKTLEKELARYNKNLLWNFVNTYYDKNRESDYVKLIQEKGPYLDKPRKEMQTMIEAA